MAADSTVSDLAGRYRRLAALVEQLEADGYNVVDAEPTEDQHGRQHADVQLNLDGGLNVEPFHAGDESERDEGEDDQDEEFEAGDEIDEDVQDDQTAAAEPVDDPLAEQIVSILEAEGELRSSDLRDRVDGNQTEFYAACDDLKEADRLSVRDDPDDGRRKLYSLAGEDGGPDWNGRDPETIVADSSLPARVVLEDILNAAADASTVIEAAETLDVDVDNLEPVCWHLTLKQPDSLEIVDDAGDQIDLIREVADE